jgi:LysR family transcriptional regulator, glycine cleavage system transcriptional activator
MNHYPPLKALVAFDAAIRTNSFSIAATELCVTPGAIGQQIQKLEQWLGVLLFTRQIRQVQPTADGLAYWQRIQPALAQILDASRSLKDSRSSGVWLSMPPSFAAKWFMRRMARFVTRHPDVELHLNASPALADFEREAVDLAIRHFDGNAPELDATLLYADEARAYCSPEYAKAQALARPDDLLHTTLLHASLHPHWGDWLRQFSQLSQAQIAAIPAIHFDQGLMAIEAARLGQGVVMASPHLTEEESADGTLIEPFALRLPLAAGYYVVHPRNAVLRPAPQACKAWLIEEASQALAPSFRQPD